MEISNLFISDNILDDTSSIKILITNKRKYDAFIRLFGIDPDTGPCKGHEVTYDEDGRANTPFYVGDELTKQEIINRMIKNKIVSPNFLGRIKAELLLHSAFPDRNYTGYCFKKRKYSNGKTKYRLEWQDFIGP